MMAALGIMREQSMRYNIKKTLSTSALALILSFGYVNCCSAQGIVSLANNAKANNMADEIPDEISLFGDDNADTKVITPAKSTTGVKSAAELLGNVNNVKNAPQNVNNSVKSAKDLLNKQAKPASNGVKSAAELLGTANANKPAASNNGVKSAAELLGQKNIPQPMGQNSSASVKSAAQLLGQKSPQAQEQPTKVQNVMPKASNIDIKVIDDVEDAVFDQMSDLEKQTAILNLELKKEKVKSDIESLKAIQEKARQEEQARKDEAKRKIQEWENAEKRKILQEQQKLKELELAYEKERQEKLLNSYKTKMLEEKQDFISSRADAFKEIAELRDERQKLINDFKARFMQLTELTDKATSEAIRIRDNYAKTVSDLQTQISILKARLETEDSQNPFANEEKKAEEEELQQKGVKLNDMYAIMEIRGQGDVLTAKLINESGTPFLVKVGTALQSGHVIDEITPTYVRADKDGKKDYLYFSAGGILDKEPIPSAGINFKASSEEDVPQSASQAILTEGIPGVAAEMTVR